MAKRAAKRADRQRGAIAVVAATVLLAIGSFMALALNVGLIMNTRGQLQNASDSSALAGAGSLDGTQVGIGRARAFAFDYSVNHKVTGAPVSIDSNDDVTFGRWHYDKANCTWGANGTDCFEPIGPSANDPALGGPNFMRITAVKVRNGRDGEEGHNDPLETYFGVFLMTNRQTKVPSAAVAVGNAAHADCPIPFGVASCKILNDHGELACDGNGVTKTLSLANANIDGMGFINLTDDGKNPNGTWAAETIAKRNCGGGQVYRTGDARMQDGNDLVPELLNALMGLTKQGNGYDVTGPCLLYTNNPNKPEVSVAVTNNDGCGASPETSNPQFNGSQDVIAFAKARILEVCDNQGNAFQCDGTATMACTNPAPGPGGSRNVTFQLLCTDAVGSGGNGRTLRLVQ